MNARRSLRWLIAACCAVPVSALFAETFPSIEMKNDFIWTAVSNAGTLGMGSHTSPGLIYDPTGTGTFDPETDYVEPGDPYEGFSVGHGGSFLHNNNNSYTSPSIQPLSLTDMAGTNGYSNYVRWVGESAEQYKVTNDFYFNPRDQRIYMKTKLTALSDLTDVKFLRTIDPDADAAGGGSNETENKQGLGTIPTKNYVESYAPVSGRRIALYSKDPVTHNTMISSDWSEDPDTAIAGTNDGDGDNTIGVGFDIGDMSAGQTVELTYSYIFVTGLIDEGEIDPGADLVRVTPMIPVHNVVGSNNRYAVGEMLNRGTLNRQGYVASAPASAPAVSGTSANPLLLSVNPQGAAARDGVSAWASAFGAGGKHSPDNGLDSYTTSSWGGLAGLEKPFGDSGDLLLGVAAGYAGSDIDVNDGDSAEVDSVLLGGYGQMNFKPYFVNASLVGGYHSVDATFEQRDTDADYDAYSVALDLGGGADFNVNDWFVVTPEGGFMIGYYDQEDFSESDDVLSYDGYDRWSYQSRLGGKISKEFELNGDLLVTPRAGLYWLHEFNNDTDTVSYTVGNFASSGSVIAFNTEEDALRMDLGVDCRIGQRWSAGIGFIGEFNDNLQDYQGYARVGYDF